jgi:hypothetical protein
MYKLDQTGQKLVLSTTIAHMFLSKSIRNMIMDSMMVAQMVKTMVHQQMVPQEQAQQDQQIKAQAQAQPKEAQPKVQAHHLEEEEDSNQVLLDKNTISTPTLITHKPKIVSMKDGATKNQTAQSSTMLRWKVFHGGKVELAHKERFFKPLKTSNHLSTKTWPRFKPLRC